MRWPLQLRQQVRQQTKARWCLMGSVVSSVALVLLLSTNGVYAQASSTTSTVEHSVLARLIFEIRDGKEAAFDQLYETVLG